MIRNLTSTVHHVVIWKEASGTPNATVCRTLAHARRVVRELQRQERGDGSREIRRCDCDAYREPIGRRYCSAVYAATNGPQVTVRR